MRIYFGLFLLFLTLTVRATDKPYFQQEVNYKINVRLDDVKNTLSATAEIEYINRSSDTLTELWFHIWPNAYADRNTALCKQEVQNNDVALYFAKEDDRGHIDSLAFTADDQTIKMEFHPKYHDVCKLILNKPLYPGQRTFIKTPFSVKLPSGKFSRMGHIGQAYAITQWYPKPAVYDQYGWHEMPYLNQGEFYSEYGSFDVKITLPENYVVGATGDLVNGEKEDEWLTANAEQTAKMTVFSKDMTFPASSSTYKTLNYKQSNVHDFAWFADKRYHVLKGEVTMPATGNMVTTWAMFTNAEAKLWQRSIEYINDGLTYYSRWIGDYPYKQYTAVDGTIAAGGGMEYPNITIVGSSGTASTLETTIVHEVGHSWCYGLLGFNEREHPWMDEGINSFYEMRYIMTKYPPKADGNINDLSGGLGVLGKILGTGEMSDKQSDEVQYKIATAIKRDQPIEGHAVNFSENNYGMIVYKKTSCAIDYLKNYLGDAAFDSTMHRFFKQWCYHHPYPVDLEKTFVLNNHQNLSWFFYDLLLSTKKLDYGIRSVHRNGDTYTLKIRNHGAYDGPITIAGFKDGKELTKNWVVPSQGDSGFTVPCKDCDVIKLDPDFETMDHNRYNNSIRTGGLFKKIEPVSFNLITHLEYPTKSRIFYLPLVGWNEYDHFMAGLMLHNMALPQHRFEYALAPMYSFSEHALAGMGLLSMRFDFGSSALQNIIADVGFRRFSYNNLQLRNEVNNWIVKNLHYNRLNPALVFNFRPENYRTGIRKSLRAELINIHQDEEPETNGTLKKTTTNFYRLTYNRKDSKALDPNTLQLKAEGNKDYCKISMTLEYKFTYDETKKGINFRIFGGQMLNRKSLGIYNFSTKDRLNTFVKDYTYDDLYFGRSENTGILSQQIGNRDAGFRLDNPGIYSPWITSLNITLDLPIKLPLKLFADIASYEGLNKKEGNPATTGDAGICICVAKNAIEIYLPLLFSKDVKNYYENSGHYTYQEKIRFMFNLQKMNPFTIREKLN
jgi:hypothetical protein